MPGTIPDTPELPPGEMPAPASPPRDGMPAGARMPAGGEITAGDGVPAGAGIPAAAGLPAQAAGDTAAQQEPAPGTAEPDPGVATALPRATTAFCRGVLHAIGMFDPAAVTDEDPAEYRTWFCLGETGMAALLAANIAVPAFFWFAGITALPLAFIGAAVLYLPLFVFLPKLIRYATDADTDAVLEAFGKNEQIRKVFWALFAALAGLVLAQVLDPAAAQEIARAIAGVAS